MVIPGVFLAVSCCTLFEISTYTAAVGTSKCVDVQVFDVLSLIEVQERPCGNLSSSNWGHQLRDVFSANNRSLNFNYVAVSGCTRNITMTVNAVVTSGRPPHAVLVEGSEKTLETVGVALLGTGIPAIAVPPSHTWFREGYKLRNVLVPRFGQSLKGWAAVDMVKPPSALTKEFIAVYKEASLSPELDAVLQAHKTAPGLHLQHFSVTMETLELGSELEDGSGETIFDSSIIDISLDTFGFLVWHLSQLPTNTVIHKQHVVIFLHDFHQVASWSGLSDLSSLTPYVFAFRQRVPLRQSKGKPNLPEYDINGAIKYDSLTALAAATACINLTNQSHVYIDVAHGSLQFTVLNEGPQIVEKLEETCIKGMAGSVGFTTGHALSSDCLNESLVMFDIMKLTLSNHRQENDLHCLSNWDVVGNWSKSGGLKMDEQLWKLSIATNQTVHRLHVLVAKFGPFAYQNAASKWEGIDVDLVNRTVEYLSTIGRLLSSGIDYIPWNGSRDTITNDFIAGNYQYDIAIGGIPVRPQKQLIYSRAYFTSSLGIMQRSANINGDYSWRFLSPFTWSVWLTVLGIILLSGCICRWLELSTDYSQSIWLAFSTVFFLQENRIAVMTNPFGRGFILAYGMFVLILTSTYTANLVSFLSPTPSAAAVSLREFVRVPVVALSSSPHLELLRQSAALEKLKTASTVAEAIESLRNGTVDAFLSETSLLLQLERVADADCNLAVVSSGFFKQQFAFSLSQNFSSSNGRYVDDAIQDAVTSGHILQSVRDHLAHGVSSFKCPTDTSFVESFDKPSQDSSDESPLDYDNMGGIFIITVIAAVMALAARAALLMWKHPKQLKVACVVSQ